MALQDNLRAELIKQFPAEAVEITDLTGNTYYACPTCKRPVALSKDKCQACDQVLTWDSIRKEEMKRAGAKTATLSFEVPGDFSKSDCRKCPLSYITKTDKENVYECPLNMRTSCPLEIS